MQTRLKSHAGILFWTSTWKLSGSLALTTSSLSLLSCCDAQLRLDVQALLKHQMAAYSIASHAIPSVGRQTKGFLLAHGHVLQCLSSCPAPCCSAQVYLKASSLLVLKAGLSHISLTPVTLCRLVARDTSFIGNSREPAEQTHFCVGRGGRMFRSSQREGRSLCS